MLVERLDFAGDSLLAFLSLLEALLSLPPHLSHTRMHRTACMYACIRTALYADKIPNNPRADT